MDPMDIQDDLAHLDPQDRLGSDLIKDQHEDWRAGKRSNNQMITDLASSSTPSLNRKKTVLIKALLKL